MSIDEERASITSGTMECFDRPLCTGQAAWRSLSAELAGTALLVTLTCVATCGDPPPDPLHRALASGLVVVVCVQCFAHISGAQLNPTVTLAAVVVGRTPWLAGAAEAAAQLAGGAAAGAVLRVLGGHSAGYCVTRPSEGVSVYKAVLTEALLGACLALANCASWDARTRTFRDSWPLRIGLTVAALALVASDTTGASMNPARSLAPALGSGDWGRHWVYWAGPLSGSALAAALYRAVWRVSPATLAPRHKRPGESCN